MPGNPGDMDLAGLHVDEEEYVVDPASPGRPDAFGEEVAGPECFESTPEELVPGVLTSVFERIYAVFPQDILDRGLGAFDKAEFLKFTDDPGVAPLIPSSQKDDKLFDGQSEFRRSASTLWRFGDRAFDLPGPFAESRVGDDRDEPPDISPQRQAELEQLVLVALAEDHPLPGAVAAQDLVLGPEVLDLFEELVLGNCGDQGKDRVVARHRGSFPVINLS